MKTFSILLGENKEPETKICSEDEVLYYMKKYCKAYKGLLRQEYLNGLKKVSY